MSPSSDPRPVLLLVDGSTYLHRAYHAHGSLSDRRGNPTGAIFGVVNALQKHLRLIHPDRVAVTLDAPGKNFRHQLYPDYKANRKPMEEDLRAQIEPLHEIIRALGLPLLVIPEVEADDVIGTLARRGEADGMDVIILSGDKDMAQLVNDHVSLHDTNHEPWDSAGVTQKFQIKPDQIIDYLALAGDAADNIPGIPKVGPKTAVDWLQRYGSMQGVVEHAEEIKGKVGEYLRDNLEALSLYQALATIKCDVPLDLEIADLTQKDEDQAQLETLYERYDLRSFLRELHSRASEGPLSTPAPQEKNYSTIFNVEDLHQWITRIRQTGALAIDTETTSLDPQQAQLIGISLAVCVGEAAYIPIGHTLYHQTGTQGKLPLEEADAQPEQRDPRQLEFAQVSEWLAPILADPDIIKIGHHLKYDRTVLQRHKLPLEGPFHDSMLESYVLKSTAGANRHNLDALARIYLDEETIRYEEVTGKGRGKVQRSFDQVSIEKATPYAAEDADISLRLHQHFWPQLEQNSALQSLYQDMELPVSLVLTDMEQHGVTIDTEALNVQSEELRQQLNAIRKRAVAEYGEEFNLNSTKDLQRILFVERGLKPKKKTPAGSPSVDEEVLGQLALEDELPKIILEHRERTKLLNTYVEKLPQMINPETARVHTSYHQAGTGTGRLSSSDPNLQNIPIRTEQGRRIRQAFIAPEGRTLIAADYSQVELRIMAHISGDPVLCQAFADGVDVHQSTAAEVFGVPQDEVTTDQRRAAKAINFGLMYGMGAFGLARQLNVLQAQAERYMETYFERYPKIHGYMEQARAQAEKCGYVETVYGRRLHLDAIHSKNYNQRRYAQRAAINAPMQGTAADIIKVSMIHVHRWLLEHHPDCAIIMQVHDELVLEAPKERAEEITQGVCELMEQAATLDVPLVVDAQWGDNWDQAH